MSTAPQHGATITATITATIKVVNEFDRELPAYDDGSGHLWVYSNSLGVVSVIRADTWEDAYNIAEDEFIPEADEPTWEAIAKECGCDDPEKLMDNATFQESYGFRPNGANVRDVHNHGIYQKALNGESLEALTPSRLAHLSLRIVLA